MTEDEYLEAQRESEAYYEQQAAQDRFYEWLSGFGFLRRALAQMECDSAAVECGAVEMFRAFLQKQFGKSPASAVLQVSQKSSRLIE